MFCKIIFIKYWFNNDDKRKDLMNKYLICLRDILNLIYLRDMLSGVEFVIVYIFVIFLYIMFVRVFESKYYGLNKRSE